MDQIIKLLSDKYGPLERLSGGFTNATFLIKTNPPIVAKVATFSNQDIENEGRALQFLNQASIAPQFVETFQVASSKIIVTTFEQGTNGQTILDTRNLDHAKVLFYNMGIALARDIHRYHNSSENTSLRIGGLDELPFNSHFVPKELIAKSRGYLEKACDNSSDWVLTHGDFGSHNILFRGNGGLTVIDWEWTEWFHPLVDIAWTFWNTKLHYPIVADELNHIFLSAYQSIRPIVCTDEGILTYSLYKLWTIFKKVENADRKTQEKWVKRLEWTLNPGLTFFKVLNK